MANLTFSAAVAEWTRKVDGALEAVFRESVNELVAELNAEVTRLVYDQPIAPSGYVRTGFLRASLSASKASMPLASRDNPGGAFAADDAIVAVIQGAELGETIYLGYTAEYSGIVHYGGNGRQPRPWVSLVAQRWDSIVSAKASELKTKLGL
jgi:hypothetical protein